MKGETMKVSHLAKYCYKTSYLSLYGRCEVIKESEEKDLKRFES